MVRQYQNGGKHYDKHRVKSREQSANNTHMVFANEEHEKFYYEKMEQADRDDLTGILKTLLDIYTEEYRITNDPVL